jgi:hypothetical protein
MDAYAAYAWSIRDTRETERKIRAFTEQVGEVWALPMGYPAGWFQHTDGVGNAKWLVDPAEPLVGEFGYSTIPTNQRGYVVLDDYWSDLPGNNPTVDEAVVVLEEMNEIFANQIEKLGDPYPLRFTYPDIEVLWRAEGSTGPWKVIRPVDHKQGHEFSVNIGYWVQPVVQAFGPTTKGGSERPT